MGEIVSKLNRLHSAKESTHLDSRAIITSINQTQIEKNTELQTQLKGMIHSRSQIAETIDITDGHKEMAGKSVARIASTPEQKLQVRNHKELTHNRDQTPLTSNLFIPKDGEKIVIEEPCVGSTDLSKKRTIFVSGDDREPELEYSEVAFEVHNTADTRQLDRNNYNFSDRDLAIQHPYPPEPESDLCENESFKVVVTVESRRNGKKRRASHSFTSDGSEQYETDKKSLHDLSENIHERNHKGVDLLQSTSQEGEDVVEVMVDFYRRKRRRRTISALCGCSALADST